MLDEERRAVDQSPHHARHTHGRHIHMCVYVCTHTRSAQRGTGTPRRRRMTPKMHSRWEHHGACAGMVGTPAPVAVVVFGVYACINGTALTLKDAIEEGF